MYCSLKIQILSIYSKLTKGNKMTDFSNGDVVVAGLATVAGVSLGYSYSLYAPAARIAHMVATQGLETQMAKDISPFTAKVMGFGALGVISGLAAAGIYASDVLNSNLSGQTSNDVNDAEIAG